jgi:hypothetical protein
MKNVVPLPISVSNVSAPPCFWTMAPLSVSSVWLDQA